MVLRFNAVLFQHVTEPLKLIIPPGIVVGGGEEVEERW